MSKPRTLAELRAEVREKGSAELAPEERDAFFQAMKEEIDLGFEAMRKTVAEAYWAPPLGGWPSPAPLTRRQRFNIWKWRARRWLAAPFLAVVRWLTPDELRSEDD